MKKQTIIILMCLFLSSNVFAGTKYVDTTASGAGNGSSWTDAYIYLQDALTSATSGDDIWVAAGTYYPSVEVGGTGDRYKTFQMKNQVEIYGGFPTGGSDFANRDPNQYETILSGDLLGNDNPATPVEDLLNDPSRADNCYHVFYHPQGTNLDPNAILDGFSITAGNADNLSGGGMYNYECSPTVSNCTFSGNSAEYRGGGMYNGWNTNPKVTDCTFTGNSAYNGGGMYNYHSSPTITGCTFTGNLARNSAGGMYNYENSPTVTGCTFTDNNGGGMYNHYYSNSTVTDCSFANNYGGSGMHNSYYSDPTVTDCLFANNYGHSGMYNGNDSNPTVTGCTFTGNSSTTRIGGKGGGMCNFYDSSPTVISCTFTSNSAHMGINNYGGGMFNSGSPTIINCTFSGNSVYMGVKNYGGGMYNSYDSSPTVTNCTFTDNSADRGGGMYNTESGPMVTNCLLWGNTASSGGNEIALINSSTIDVDYCDVQGGQAGIYDDLSGNTINWGSGNIDADPLFVDPNNDDYRLQPGSPCIDAGDPNYEPEPNVTDLQGNPRIIDGDGDGVAIVDMGAYETPLPPLEAQMKLTPQTLNCSSQGNWIKAHFVLPAGFGIEDVDTAKPATIDSLTILSDHINVSYNTEGLVEIEAAFSRNDFCSTGLFGNTELTVRGFLTDGTGFQGTDNIRITTNQLQKLPEFSSHWLQTDCVEPDFCNGFDLDHNGTVNLADFALLAEN